MTGRWVWLLHWNMHHYVKGDRAVCGRFPRGYGAAMCPKRLLPSLRVFRNCERIAAQEGA